MPKRSGKRRADLGELAARAAAETGPERHDEPKRKKNRAAVALGRKGGKKGGPARMAKLTPAERSELAKKGAKARWERKEAEAGQEGG